MNPWGTQRSKKEHIDVHPENKWFLMFWIEVYFPKVCVKSSPWVSVKVTLFGKRVATDVTKMKSYWNRMCSWSIMTGALTWGEEERHREHHAMWQWREWLEWWVCQGRDLRDYQESMEPKRKALNMWTKNTSYHINKPRMFQPSATTATLDSEPSDSSGWGQKGYPLLSL